MVRKIGVLTTVLLTIALVINVGDARATPIDVGIVNPGFDDLVLGEGASDAGEPNGWDIKSAHMQYKFWYGVWDPETDDYSDGASGRENIAYIETRSRPETGIVWFEQTISGVSLSADDYYLQVDVGNSDPNDDEGYNYAGFPGYEIQILAGGNLLGSDANTLSPEENQFLTSQVSFSITDQFDGNLTIKLMNLSQGAGREVDFDNVRVSDAPLATPEPATMLLLGAGLIGLAGIGRKKLFRK